ncbi:MAG TPA: cellulase family glycosylhydrolase [Bryobacteraceae bacterium]|nr:cellulase family glycosylhydrolase [Bryobacteraceae bacterium]
MRIIAKLVVLGGLWLPGLAAANRFVHTDGTHIVAPDGEKLHLRGINLGNWLVPEGYMWHFDKGPASYREISALLNDLIGPDEAQRFWKQYRAGYITEADMRFIHDAGFNSVRIPFNYRLIDDGSAFPLLDQVIRWCRQMHIWVILDMHCAPGGQTGTNIDDSWGYPWLFESDAEQQAAAAFWRSIAQRYADEPAVLGYDLLNEPIPPPVKYLNPRLEPVYRRIIAAIRLVDKNHAVILGGAQWDSNFEPLGPPVDPNAIYTFHKYWTSPTKDVIQSYLDFRERYQVPIWMGESGENQDSWIAQFRTKLDSSHVGWAFWPYKKMDATSSPVSFARPVFWNEIVAYAALPGGVGAAEDKMKKRPPAEHVRAAFADLLEKIKLENCRVNEGYLKALGMRIAPAK